VAAAPAIDGLFRALADPTRRRVLERLAAGPASVGELAEPFQMALPSFVAHLAVLEGAKLVRSQKNGRVRTYRLEPDRLADAENWLAKQRDTWRRRLDRLDEYLLKMKENAE
jgi:DNA-binding transcriptional ArsR family regulator